MLNQSGLIIRREKNTNQKILTQRNEKGRTMGKAHVKGLPLGAIVFVLIVVGGVFPSMAQAVNLTINFGGSGTGRVDGSGLTGTGPLLHFYSNTNPVMTFRSTTILCHPYANPTRLGPSKSTFAGWTGCASTSGTQCTVI